MKQRQALTLTVALGTATAIGAAIATYVQYDLQLSRAAAGQPGQMAAPDPSPVAASKVVLHVDQNDPAVMNLALNNVQNVASHYKAAGLPVTIEVVAYGPGLHMLRADTSPIKARLASFTLELPDVRFSACENTQTNMSKAEGKPVPILSDARLVPSGVVRLIELQQQSYAYIKP